MQEINLDMDFFVIKEIHIEYIDLCMPILLEKFLRQNMAKEFQYLTIFVKIDLVVILNTLNLLLKKLIFLEDLVKWQ